MTGESTIDYEGLAQEAMRGVVRKVLVATAKSGLAGDHHFYISFDTEAPGVALSKRLKEKYPREMTIVLQHRFWDLAVNDDRFEVKLTFDGIPEKLVVPFSAIKVFFDPSVRFGLQFEDPNAGPEARAENSGGAFEPVGGRGGATRTRKGGRTGRKPQVVDEAGERRAPASNGRADKVDEPADRSSAKSSSPPRAANSGDAGRSSEDETPATETPGKLPGAEIVSLDKFRKK
jgi:hypothetical protein